MKSYIVLLLIGALQLVADAQTHRSLFAPRQAMRTRMDSLQTAMERKTDEQQNIIVEFTDQPLFLARMNSAENGKGGSPDSYLSQFSQFSADADAILNALPSAPSDHVSIRHEYCKAFFGASLSVPSRMLPMLQQLPYVKAIHFDREVHAYIEPAIELIGAPVVWVTFGTRGQGIRIGIIDSGIDYIHPALGGGFGNGFKVAGGYDVVNNDGDPMDDNGHGTHVAGIVAADADTVKGVAPLATLYAIKALNAAGVGLDSDILEAIEWSVDPDQNGDDADKLDIVNMSLGRDGGSPTDPTSIAVNNATLLGVVFCVAAGNSGARTPTQGKENNYFFDGSATIGSPGTAEQAITVGASVLSDTVARFSSKGPNRTSFSIKPDVVAPGVDINSTYLNSEYKVLSGTSMATPMVTGVAALLKSIHPAWSPSFIKSAIVNKALDIGKSPYLQGGGRVQAAVSAAAQTLVVPSNLSYGLDDPAAATWISPETLFVFNNGVTTQSYIVTTSGSLPGVSLNVTPSSFSIPANDSTMVVVTLSVNNSQVTIVDDDILRFTGSVAFNGTFDTARVPWAFVRTNLLVITMSEPNASFLGYSNASFVTSTSATVSFTSPTRAEVYAPLKGTYEFFTLFRNPAGISKIVINEGISINNDFVNLFLNAAQAVNPLVYRGVDHMGNPLTEYRASRRALITSLPNLGDFTSTFVGGSDTLLISAASNIHSFKPIEFQVDLVDTKSMHIIQFNKFTGMNGPRTAVNSPGNFIQQHFRVKVPPGTASALTATQIWSYVEINGTGGFGGIGFDIDTVSIAGDEYAYTGYFGKSSIPSEDIAATFFTSYSNPATLPIDYESSFMMPYKDSIVSVPREFVTPAVPRFESGATMTFGGAPVHLYALWYNNSFGTNTLHFRTVFRGMLRETRNVDNSYGTYSVFDKNGAEVLTRSLNDPRSPLQLTADEYKVVITSNGYWLRNARGTLTLSSEFDLGAGFTAIPPSVTSFMLLDSDGHTTDSFGAGGQGTLQFAVNTFSGPGNQLPIFDSTKAWYRKHGTSAWQPLTLSKVAEIASGEGLIVEADLGAALAEDSVAIDLRVASKDSSGFTVDQIVAPAFAVGNWDTVLTDVKPAIQEIPARFSLEQNYPNPFNPVTVISYTVPQVSTAPQVGTLRYNISLKVYDVLGREVATLVNEKQDAGTYSVTWNANGVSSGVYFYRLQAGSNVGTKKLLLLK